MLVFAADVQDEQHDINNVKFGRKRIAHPAEGQESVNEKKNRKERIEKGLSYSGQRYIDESFKAFENVENEKGNLGERC